MQDDTRKCTLETLDTESQSEIYLYVIDDGYVVFRTPENSYKVVVNHVTISDGMPALYIYACDGSKSPFTYELSVEVVQTVREYFIYWSDNALGIVKQQKLQNFLDFWDFTINFVRDNVDVETLKPTYELYASDYREYEGDLTIHFEVAMGGKYVDSNGELDYYRCFALNDKWLDEYLDLAFHNDYNLFGKIFIAFRP